jgi:hypothetical protein
MTLSNFHQSLNKRPKLKAKYLKDSNAIQARKLAAMEKLRADVEKQMKLRPIKKGRSKLNPESRPLSVVKL